MGREMRRAQERAERRQQSQRALQPSRTPSISAPAAPGEVQPRGSLLKPRWAMDIASELRKVTWPSRRETANLTAVVIVVSMALGLVLGGADLLFGWIIQQALAR